ncbi:hypothetical protein Tco_1408460 [Tanacetum coccineum]
MHVQREWSNKAETICALAAGQRRNAELQNNMARRNGKRKGGDKKSIDSINIDDHEYPNIMKLWDAGDFWIMIGV